MPVPAGRARLRLSGQDASTTSSLSISDVTFATTRAYLEAGYALCMGRPVIWTCRSDRQAQDMHFDTRQYNHMLWENSADLREQLYYRVVATIGPNIHRINQQKVEYD
jgi:hypothetical protein